MKTFHTIAHIRVIGDFQFKKQDIVLEVDICQAELYPVFFRFPIDVPFAFGKDLGTVFFEQVPGQNVACGCAHFLRSKRFQAVSKGSGIAVIYNQGIYFIGAYQGQ